jgi:2,3,4,5-tetrahydropyridine-2,6-dicarboxylate N-succinyltransferase
MSGAAPEPPDDERLRAAIEAAWDLPPDAVLDPEACGAVEETLRRLDTGAVRVAEPRPEGWTVNEWVKKAILLFFRVRRVQTIELGPFEYRDKIPLKRGYGPGRVRVVPPGTARYGAYVSPGAVLMPSYVNVGAWVGPGTMVDTWATVGSCAQIGANVHLSGGVGIGGVLEPPQARPVIVEDGAFVGSRCILVEGVLIGERAVLGANVVITASTAILDVTGERPVEHRGAVPPRSVVIPGTRTKRFPAGEYQVPAALIVGMRSEATDLKVSLNQALREFDIGV